MSTRNQSAQAASARPVVAAGLLLACVALGVGALTGTSLLGIDASAASGEDRPGGRIAVIVGAHASAHAPAIRAAVQEALRVRNADADGRGRTPLDAVVVTVPQDASAASAIAALLATGHPHAMLVAGSGDDLRAALAATEGTDMPILSLVPADPTIDDDDLLELAGTVAQRIGPAIAWLAEHAGDRMVCVRGERPCDRVTASLAGDALRLRGAVWRETIVLSDPPDRAEIMRAAQAIAASDAAAIVTALPPHAARALASALRAVGIDPRRVPTLHLAFEETSGLEGDLSVVTLLPHEDPVGRQRLRALLASTLVDGRPVGRGAVCEAALRVPGAIDLLAVALGDGAARDSIATAAALRRATAHGPMGTAVVERRGGLWLHPGVVRLDASGVAERVWSGAAPLAPSHGNRVRTALGMPDDQLHERGDG